MLEIGPEILQFVATVLGSSGIIGYILYKIVDRRIDSYFRKMDEKEKKEREKDRLILKGLIQLNNRQYTIMNCLKKANLDGTLIIPINGELEEAKKQSKDYADEWEEFLISNQEQL